MATSKVWFRVDTSSKIGSGHLFRCLALAEAIKSAGTEVAFLCRELPGHLASIIPFPVTMLPAYDEDAGFPWSEDAALTAAKISGDILVVDHYSIDARWEKKLRQGERRLLVIDDLANRPHDCDWLLDSGYVPRAEYRYDGLLSPGTRLLLGPRYALLRSQFVEARQPRDYLRASRILAYFGAAAPMVCTMRFIEALRGLDTDATLLVAKGDPNRTEILAAAARLPKLECLENAENVAERMRDADIFLGAGGTITWERCCLGLPSVVVAVAENQVPSSARLGRRGKVLYLGTAEAASAEAMRAALALLLSSRVLRRSLGQSSLALIDGAGARRAAKMILGAPVSFRKIRESDAELIFAWRNHEATRRYSLDSKELTLEGHQAWLKKKLSDPDVALLLALEGTTPVGTLRLDRTGANAVVSIYLDPARHGQGLGPAILLEAQRWTRENWLDVRSLEAHIVPQNRGSLVAFAEAGFRKGWSALVCQL